MVDANLLWSLLAEREKAGLTRRRVVSPSGVGLNVVERPGDGTPVIMLHGIWGWWGYWRALATAKPDPFGGRRLLMVDLRGHGDSDKPDSGYTLDAYAADIVGLIEAEALDSAVILGHSLGALTALLVAAEIPESIEALILEDPPLPMRPGGTDVFRGVFDLKQEELARVEEELRFWQPGTSVAQARESALCLKATANGVFAVTFQDGFGPTQVPVAGVMINAPALVILAGDPEATALRRGGEELLRAALPDVRLVRIDGTSHTVLRDDAAAYMRVLTEFLASV